MTEPGLLDEMKRELQNEVQSRKDWLLQRIADAREMVRMLADRFHHFAEANMQMAEFHLQHGNFSDAALRYRFVLWKQPDNADAWAGLGVALLSSGEKDKAREALEKALKLAPGHARAEASLASLATPVA